MNLSQDRYLNMRQVAAKLGIEGKDPSENARQFCRRHGIPMDYLGRRRVVLITSLEEAMKRMRRSQLRIARTA